MKSRSRGALALVGIVVLLGALGAHWAERAIRQGAKEIAHPARFEFPDRPENYGLAYERVRFPAAVDQTGIAGWLLADPERRGRLVIVVPGYRSHKQHMLREYIRWLAEGFGVLAIDPRGNGESDPAACTLGDHERRDVAGAIAFARRRGYDRIALFGTSMGGAASLGEGPEHPEVRGIASDGAPATTVGGLTGLMRHRRYPFPEAVATLVVRQLGLDLGHPIGEGDAVRHVAHMAPRPLLLIHGSQDHVVPVEQVDELAGAADPRSTTVVKFADADHLSNMVRSPHRLHRLSYESRVLAFLHRCLD